MTFLQYLIAGLLMGSVYALMSTGLALMFGVMRIVNVAQGDFMMLGMYCTYFLHAAYWVQPVYGAFLIVPLFYGLGTMVHRVLLVHVSGRGTLQEMPAQLILTLGLSVILTHGVIILLGPMPRSIVTPLATTAFYEHGMLFNQARTYAGVAALGVVSAVALGIRYTALGRALRRCADEPEAARALGIDVRRIHTIACGLSIALTATAGGLLATFWPIEPTVGAHFIILMFLAVVLGGMGSMLGTLLGGLMIGVVQSLSVLVLPLQLHNVSVLVVFLVVLSLRPHGLFGRHERVV